MKKKKNYSLDIGKGLTLLSQLAISIITPMLLFTFAARFLVNKGWIPSWLIPFFIIFGLAVGIMSAWNMVQAMMKQQEKELEKRKKDFEEDLEKKMKDKE